MPTPNHIHLTNNPAMRKIERQLIHAINTPGKQWSNTNTKVRWSDDQTFVEVLLHDHIIASISYNTRKLAISACGWETTTTKSRLNAILSDLVPGARIFAKAYIWHLAYNDKTVEFSDVENTAFAF